MSEDRMDGQTVKRVVIAGGGTAGWCAAAALARQLGGLLDVTLVESDAIGTVGVGESTIPTVRAFHRILGIDERDFLRATHASFKLGIDFRDWSRIGDRYIHSFGDVGRSTWMGGFQHFWLEGRAEGVAGPLGDYCLELQAAEAGRFSAAPETPLNYAYHLDATAYGGFLRTIGEAAGVRRIEGRIADVALEPESGFIEALVLDDGRRIEGDLFIDCTGFRALLMGEALDIGFEDWGRWLTTDRAIAVQTERTGPAPLLTRAIAHDAGWRWEIPLQHRVGNGLVYASAHLSEEAARERLLSAIGGAPIGEPRVVRYKTGRRRKTWHRNCIALGLSSGFVEPLESTSIHLIMIGVTRLMQLFPFGGVTASAADRYNALADAELEAIRDFIILHYHLTERDDSPFWRGCRDMEVPETLARRIALFRDNAQAYQASDELFRVSSWVQVMLGQRVEPLAWNRMARLMGPARLGEALGDIKRNVDSAVARLPDYHTVLGEISDEALAAE
jgi:tryptophan halogenase